jgi:hypothetical protein
MDKGVGKHQKVRSVTAKTEIRVENVYIHRCKQLFCMLAC